MANPHPSVKFTSETGKAASKLASTKTKMPLKLERLRIKGVTNAQQYELVKAVLSNPAVIGTILFLLVSQLNKGTSGSFTIPFLGVTIPSAGNISYDLLEGAILAYIATGGNLAGTLQGGANLLEKLPGILAGFTAGVAP